ncbi:MAG: hypothetical protein KKF26_07955, partial [Chloroflexi bacterium]|nr:hypothetical protein [Chloroflexota bacterium]
KFRAVSGKTDEVVFIPLDGFGTAVEGLSVVEERLDCYHGVHGVTSNAYCGSTMGLVTGEDSPPPAATHNSTSPGRTARGDPLSAVASLSNAVRKEM